MAAMANTKHSARKARRIRRGLTNGDIMRKPEMKRMPASMPWAAERRAELLEAERPTCSQNLMK